MCLCLFTFPQNWEVPLSAASVYTVTDQALGFWEERSLEPRAGAVGVVLCWQAAAAGGSDSCS